jgi:hypothetical protein
MLLRGLARVVMAQGGCRQGEPATRGVSIYLYHAHPFAPVQLEPCPRVHDARNRHAAAGALAGHHVHVLQHHLGAGPRSSVFLGFFLFFWIFKGFQGFSRVFEGF